MIIGFSFSHNATTCLLDDHTGEVLFCCSEERFTRNKNDWGIPYLTLDYIFNHIVPKERISAIAVGELCRSYYGSRDFIDMMHLGNIEQKDSFVSSKPKMMKLVFKELTGRLLSPKYSYQSIVREKFNRIGLHADIYFFDHHKSHAASGFYSSPFKDALVITLDGEGDGNSGSCWIGSESGLKLLYYLPEISSVGKFYRSITLALGFNGDRHEGKITGLASYGDPDRYYPELSRVLNTEIDDQGNKKIVSRIAEKHMRNFNLRKVNILKLIRQYTPVFLESDTFHDFSNAMLRKQFKNMYGEILGKKIGDYDYHVESDFTEMADIAAATQRVTEEAITDFIKFYIDKSPIKNVVLAGGVFANVKVNQRVLEVLDTKDIYIHPGMGDEGLALGAAKLLFHNDSEKKKVTLTSVFLGPVYDEDEIEAELKKFRFHYEKLDDREIFEIVSSALVDEKIVGLFRGRLEYGPRALGHRTILINPVKREINDVVNKRLKRTEFMPFAPVVLQECYEDLFKSEKLVGAHFACKFMTITLDVKKEWSERILGVVHVDGTARPQVIEETDDPFYYGIVKKFFEKTGIGCVVNTSFNMHEEPIVNTPYDALRSFETGAVDLLVMENFLVRR